MEYKIQIEKTDVKLYEIDFHIEENELKKFVDENYETFDQFVEDNELNEEEVNDISPEEYYKNYLTEFIEDQDPDLLFSDWCQDHSQYHLESEECCILSVRK